MKHTQPETLFAQLVQTHRQKQLLVRLLTQNDLRCFAVYQHEADRIRQQQHQALKQLAHWLQRMHLQQDMLQMLQQNPTQPLPQAQTTQQTTSTSSTGHPSQQQQEGNPS